MTSVDVRPLVPGDAEWVRSTLVDQWGSVFVARKAELIDASALGGFVATRDGKRVGLANVDAHGDEYEVVTISTTVEGQGVGRALIAACFGDALALGCRRVWLTTTNDNLRAIAFYQRVGMDLCAFYRNAVEAARALKPTIPLHDADGVPIAHELEFELMLGGLTRSESQD